MQRIALSSALAGLLLAGCVLRDTIPYDPAHPRRGSPPIERSDLFAYPRGDDEPDQQILVGDRHRTHLTRLLRWPSSGNDPQAGRLVIARYYQSTRPGPHKLVIVLPLWGGHTYPPRKVSDGLLSHYQGESHVLRLMGPSYLFDWDALAAAPDGTAFRALTRRMNERMRIEVIDIRRILDWAGRQPEIDAGRIALVGFSMSAVIGGIVLGADERIRAAALVMGGANLGEIVARCDGPLQRVRESVTGRLGWTDRQYLETVVDAFATMNPARFPSRTDPSRVLMFDSKYDECMPLTARNAFWESLGRPLRITFRRGHKGAFLAMTPLGLNYLDRRIFRFLDEKL